ncbi:hypothetical protein AAFF_G00390660, partial [Aldrovandia affinis]
LFSRGCWLFREPSTGFLKRSFSHFCPSAEFRFFLIFFLNILNAWVSSGYSGFLPQSKDIHVSLIGESKLPIGMSV